MQYIDTKYIKSYKDLVISENMNFEGKEYSNIFEYLDKFVDNTLYESIFRLVFVF